MIEIRAARSDDDGALTQVDAVTWTPRVTPGPPPAADAPFFGECRSPEDVLIAAAGGEVVGYAIIGQAIPLASHRHALELRGLAVHPTSQGAGVGRQLVEATLVEARAREARKLSLRVLARNTAARWLYERAGSWWRASCARSSGSTARTSTMS